MIIGNGGIAAALREGGVDNDGFCYFASGVSNSQETNEAEFWRERFLITQQNRDYWFVYFSSLSVFYSDSIYADHKFEMERLVKETFPHHTILRLGNITWGENPHTLINTLRERERLGLPQNIQDVYRYLVDKDEFIHWIRLIPDWSCEMNIPGRRMKVAEIYREFVTNEIVAALR